VNWQLNSATIVALLLATVRTSAWLMVCPPFNSRLIPAQVKALLSVAISLAVTPRLAASAPPLEVGPLLESAIQQVAIGLALGFLTSLTFAAVQAAGDMLDMFGGFSMAQAFDPLSAVQSSVFGRLFNLVAITLLFVTDAHQMVLRGFALSFRTLPLDGTLSLAALNRLLTHGLGEMLLAALQIAGPLIAVLFCTDVALGLLNRVAPALNAFALGFPAKVLLTLSLAGFSLMVLPHAVSQLIDKAVTLTVGLAGG
jgi:flagellar biosynthetic protein FliR